eukprot:248384-Prorocentrum_minimum.AAC.1
MPRCLVASLVTSRPILTIGSFAGTPAIQSSPSDFSPARPRFNPHHRIDCWGSIARRRKPGGSGSRSR